MTRRTTTQLLLALALLPAGPAMAQSTWHVNGAVASSGDGTSWSEAFKTLQEGLDDAVVSAGDQVWVAARTYLPGLARGDSFQLISAVQVYGGFPATGNPGFFDRDPAVHVTTLSGDINGDDLPDFGN